MRVLIYINTVSRFNYGNLMSNLELMQGFLEAGVDVVFAVNRRTQDDVDLPVDVLPLNGMGDFDRPLKLKALVERVKPHAVIANMLTQITTAFFTKLLLQSSRPKFLGIERDTRPWHRKLIKIPYRLFIKGIYEGINCTVAVSPAVKRDLQRTFFVSEDRIRVIYDPFDIHGIRKASEEALEPELEEFFREGKVLVCVGRLDKQKEPLLALEVFLKLREKRRDVKLCFVGGGELEEAVRSRIRYHGLEKEVLITGFRENPFSYMRRAKLLIHTASREGLGRVILEGMALGLPVVAFCNEDSGYRELIEEGRCGILIPFGDREGMVKSIATLLQDEELYRSLSASALEFSERFQRRSIVEEYLNILS